MPQLAAQDVPRVLQLLSQALESNVEVQRQAEAALASLEEVPGFCSVLAEIVGTGEADPSARWLAAVHLKNQVTKQWRRRGSQQALSPDEKAYLRSKLLALIDQEDNQVAVQVAVAVSRVARVDFPKEWPSLFSELISKAASGTTLVVRRVYFVLHHVLKELSTKRLAADQQTFAQVTASIFDHVWSCWSEDTHIIVTNFSAALQQPQQAQPVLLRFERWLLLLKVVRRLLLHGFPSDVAGVAPVEAVVKCAPAMLQALQVLLQAQAAGQGQSRLQLAVMLERGLLKLLKTQVQILEVHPWSYCASGALFQVADCCCTQLLTRASGQGQLSDQLLTQCCVLLVSMQQCPSYKGKATLVVSAKQGPAASDACARVQQELAGFWSPQRVTVVAEALLQRHLPLTHRDLDEWHSAPEEWYHQQDGGLWKEALRPAAEHLFLILLDAYREVLAPCVASLLQTVSQQCPAAAPTPRITPELLLKEAVYSVAAVGSYQLHDYLDFTAWLHSQLLQDMQDTQPATRPIRRAACKVVAAWVPRLAATDRPAVYQCLLKLLGEGSSAAAGESGESNVVVGLAAAACLRALVDDFGFEEGQLEGLLGPLLQCLAAMLHQVTALDSQTQVFNVVNIIVERMGAAILPFAGAILGLLPGLWQEAEGQTLLRIQILESLQKVVTMLGPASPESYSVVGPLLEYALDLSHPESLSLLEDGLALWLVALRNAASPQPPLLHLFPRLPPIMASSTEHIAAGMSIIGSSVLLGGRDFLAQYGGVVAGVCLAFLGEVKDKGMVLVLGALALCLLAVGGEAAGPLQPALLKLLHVLLYGQESTIVVSSSLDVLARLAVTSIGAFQQLFGAAAAAFKEGDPGVTADSLLARFLDLWTDSFDSIGTVFSRKLSALAMCALLGVQSGAVLQYLPLLLVSITSVWSEQERPGASAAAESDGSMSSMREAARQLMEGGEMLVHPAALESEDAEGEFQRRQQVQSSDIVLQLRIGPTLSAQLKLCASLHGHAFDAAMAALDPAIKQQVNEAMR